RVAEDEAEEVQRLVVLRIQPDGALETRERFLIETSAVRDLAEVEVHQRALRIHRQRLIEPALRHLDVADRLLREAELDQRAEIVRVILQQRLELDDGVGVSPQQRVRAAQLPPRFALARARAQG